MQRPGGRGRGTEAGGGWLAEVGVCAESGEGEKAAYSRNCKYVKYFCVGRGGRGAGRPGPFLGLPGPV